MIMTSYTTNRYYRVTLTILSERTGTNSKQDHPVMLDYAKNVFQLSQGENNLTPCCVGTAFFTDVLRLNIAYEKKTSDRPRFKNAKLLFDQGFQRRNDRR